MNRKIIINEPFLVGGLGEKKSNEGTQWYLQDRIYLSDITLAIATCCNPYYLIVVNK